MTAAVDERTRFELYYPPFAGAVAAGVGSVMCSYNKIQTDGLNEYGDWSCENAVTLRRDLKDIMGFKGWAMSDWGATHSSSIMQVTRTQWSAPPHVRPGCEIELAQSGHLDCIPTCQSPTLCCSSFLRRCLQHHRLGLLHDCTSVRASEPDRKK